MLGKCWKTAKKTGKYLAGMEEKITNECEQPQKVGEETWESNAGLFKRWNAATHLDAVAHIVQKVVVYGLPDVPDRSLHVRRCDDLMSPWRVFVRGKNTDFPPGHLLFVDVHCLQCKVRTQCHCQTSGRLKWDKEFGGLTCSILSNCDWMMWRDRVCSALVKATIVKRHKANAQSNRAC